MGWGTALSSASGTGGGWGRHTPEIWGEGLKTLPLLLEESRPPHRASWERRWPAGPWEVRREMYSQPALQAPGLGTHLGLGHIRAPNIPGLRIYLGSGHTWARVIPGLGTHLGLGHTWAQVTSGLGTQLGLGHSWARVTPGLGTHLALGHSWVWDTAGFGSHLGSSHTWAQDTPGLGTHLGLGHTSPPFPRLKRPGLSLGLPLALLPPRCSGPRSLLRAQVLPPPVLLLSTTPFLEMKSSRKIIKK